MQTNQTVLITGASSGIGFELARCFARDGYKLLLVSRTAADLDESARKLQVEFGAEVDIIPCDLSTHDGPVHLYQETKRRGYQVDVLVNDAGFGEYGLFVETDLQKELGMIHLNVLALVHLTKLFLKEMVARDSGKIMQLGSVVSFMPNPLQAVYAATKAFVLSFSEALQNEVEDSNVTITILCPPATDTNFFNVAGAENTKIAQSDTADPVQVAEAGYKGLLNGDKRVFPTLGAKLNFLSSNLFPDSMLAAVIKTQMQEVK